MTPERARELLGGLASGILTAQERSTLFEAALHDQTLFNEVADELEFSAFLESPETRAQLANRIEVEPQRRSWFAAKSRWFALTGALAAASVVFVVVWNRSDHAALPQAEMAKAPAAVLPAPPNVAAPPSVSAATPKLVIPAPKPAPKQEPQALEKPKIEARRDAPGEAQALRSRNEPPPPPAVADEKALPPGTAGGGPSSTPPASQPLPKAAPAAPRAMPSASSSGLFRANRNISASGAALLTGTVRDASGNVIPDASVDVASAATAATTQTTTDAEGRFRVPGTALPPGGPYTVTVQKAGFKKEQRAGLVIAANQPLNIDIPLQVGAMAESVAITASAANVSPSPQPQQQPQAPRQIAVLDFVGGSSPSESGQQAADMLSNQLLDSGQVRIIDRQKVKQAAEQQAKNTSRAPSAKDAAAVGRALGADAVVVGSIRQDGDQSTDKVAVSAEVIDTKKGRAMTKVVASGSSLQGATNSVGVLLSSRIGTPLSGSVTRVEAESVTVTFRDSGAPRIGARVEVFRGNRKIGEVTLTSAYGQTAAGTFSGATPPRAGDRVSSPR